jgi:DNA-binding transcriptional ArsR family regulator
MVQYSSDLDEAFSALADATRRGIVDRVGRQPATITELADGFGMTLTGVKKHVRILEDAKLVATKKVGRVRWCTLGPRRLDLLTTWMEHHRQMLAARLDRLDEFLERTKGSES